MHAINLIVRIIIYYNNNIKPLRDWKCTLRTRKPTNLCVVIFKGSRKLVQNVWLRW